MLTINSKQTEADIKTHDRLWKAQCRNSSPDPAKMREIYELYEHDLNGISGTDQAELKTHKAAFLGGLDKQIAIAELKEIKRTFRPQKESQKLDIMTDALIGECSCEDYQEYCERLKKKKNKYNEIAYSIAVYVMKLRRIEAEAALHPSDPFAAAVKECVKKHIFRPEVLEMLSETENMEMEKKVDEIKLAAEDEKLEKYRDELKSVTGRSCPDGMSGEVFFEKQKNDTIDSVAKIIAAQTAARTIKSMKAGAQDLAGNGSGSALTEKELNEESKKLLSDEYLEQVAAFIKTRDDFIRMTKNINDQNSLDELVKKAMNKNELLEALLQAGKEIISEDTQRLAAQQQKPHRSAEPMQKKPDM